MSDSVQPSEEEFFAALKFLFGFRTLGNNRGVVIDDEDIRKYAKIGAFLCDQAAVCVAMKDVSRWMLDKFKTFPEQFAYGDEAPFVQRMAGQRDHISNSQPDMTGVGKKERNSVIGSFGASKRVMLGAFDNTQAAMRNLSASPEIGDGLADAGNGVLVRKFRFRKLLAALEAEKLGLEDCDIVYTEDVKISNVLLTGKVWKDSIGFDHGEYTHRLQWLAIQCHFDWDKATCLRLYRGTAATLKASVYQAFGFASVNDVPDASADMALPVNVWAFLFDGREARGQARSCWPTVPASVTKGQEHEQYRHAGRTLSCRSPAFLNRILKASAEFGLIHAYLTASSIKLLEPALGRANPASPGRAISDYRNERERLKHPPVLQVFEMPFAPQLGGDAV